MLEVNKYFIIDTFSKNGSDTVQVEFLYFAHRFTCICTCRPVTVILVCNARGHYGNQIFHQTRTNKNA